MRLSHPWASLSSRLLVCWTYHGYLFVWLLLFTLLWFNCCSKLRLVGWIFEARQEMFEIDDEIENPWSQTWINICMVHEIRKRLMILENREDMMRPLFLCLFCSIVPQTSFVSRVFVAEPGLFRLMDRRRLVDDNQSFDYELNLWSKQEHDTSLTSTIPGFNSPWVSVEILDATPLWGTEMKMVVLIMTTKRHYASDCDCSLGHRRYPRWG